uniref:Uncharacterized protein TCIL3000_8_7360 n=1 Tax=Trypanosoma congolense (strain IL3000) TaxID=1068625 RepID=G0USZ4_TRYCI|nr:unnamed protein product [Trypanosoma congolense IL3000]
MDLLYEEINAPPEYIGHVVGERGATIARLQSETGATITIIDGCKVHITAEDPTQLRAATECVRQIISDAINPDYEGPDGRRLRKEAAQLASKRAQLFNEATRQREEGNMQQMSALLEQGKQVGEQMKLTNREAAAAIAWYNNEGKGRERNYFDMHGLRVDEALEMLRARVEALRVALKGASGELRVITGVGRHSGPEGAKLRRAAVEFFRAEGLVFEEVSAAEIRATVTAAGPPVGHHQPQREADQPVENVEKKMTGSLGEHQKPQLKKVEETKFCCCF